MRRRMRRSGGQPVTGGWRAAPAAPGTRRGKKREAMATHKYDLVIVGAGSGNMLPAPEFADWRIAVVEADRFGGTCLNRGCVPSKMLVHTADVAQAVRHAGRFGIGARWTGAD